MSALNLEVAFEVFGKKLSRSWIVHLTIMKWQILKKIHFKRAVINVVSLSVYFFSVPWKLPLYFTSKTIMSIENHLWAILGLFRLNNISLATCLIFIYCLSSIQPIEDIDWQFVHHWFCFRSRILFRLSHSTHRSSIELIVSLCVFVLSDADSFVRVRKNTHNTQYR